MSNRKKRILFVSILAAVTVAVLLGGIAYLSYFLSLVCSGPVELHTASLLFFFAVVWGVSLFGVLDLWSYLFSFNRKKKSLASEV